MAEFYHIYVFPKNGITKDQIEKKMNLAVDWIRYGSNNYIVYTTSDKDKWKARLIDFVKPEGSLLICKLDVNDRQGWMSRKFWEWLKAKPTTD
mgnify:CR=1 FL=1